MPLRLQGGLIRIESENRKDCSAKGEKMIGRSSHRRVGTSRFVLSVVLSVVSCCAMIMTPALGRAAYADESSSRSWERLSPQLKQSSYGFFMWRAEHGNTQLERDTAKDAASMLVNSKLPETKITGQQGSATSLLNFYKAARALVKINQWRLTLPNEPCRIDLPKNKGRACDDPSKKLTPYLTNDTLMAVSQVNADFSDQELDHADNHGQSISSAFYHDRSVWEVAAWNSDRLNNDAVPSGAWQWYNEKSTYDKKRAGDTAATGETGHYTTLTNKYYSTYVEFKYAGFGFNTIGSEFPATEIMDCMPETDWSPYQGYSQSADDYFKDVQAYADLVYPGGLFRLAGATRYDTMSRVVDEADWDTGGTVVVASGENYPDALAASGYAGVKNSPIILTSANVLEDQARMRIAALHPSTIVVVGGESAISRDVVSSLRNLSSNVIRVAGTDRVGTSLQLYRSTSGWGKTAILATAGSFADALSISSYAYVTRSPVFLVGQNGLTPGQRQSLSAGGFSSLFIVGGQTAIPFSVEEDAMKAASLDWGHVVRCAGENRYETSAAIARWVATYLLSMEGAVLATGTNFPDALAAGPFAGKTKSVMLLADSPQSPTIAFAASKNKQVRRAYVVGGVSAIDEQTELAFAQALGIPRR